MKNKKIYWQKYYQNHKKEFSKRYKIWCKNNPDRVKELGRKSVKSWRMRNPQKKRDVENKYKRKRIKIDPKFRLDQNISRVLNASLKGLKAEVSWQKLVGYSINELIIHLEKQFDEKMCWNNYGSYWHLDHKRPKSWFKYDNSNDEEFKKCWELKNLQPLEAKENIKKKNYYESL